MTPLRKAGSKSRPPYPGKPLTRARGVHPHGVWGSAAGSRRQRPSSGTTGGEEHGAAWHERQTDLVLRRW